MTSSAAMTGALEKLSWNYILISVITLITLILFIRRRKFTAHPPCYYGWIPWFGCAFEFGKEPLIFIGDSWKRMGPTFTLKIAGRRMTFLMNSDDFHHFFQSNKVDFQKAVQPSVEKTGETNLVELVRETMYVAVLDNLFGENILPTSQQEAFRQFEKHFVKFDDDFEYGCQLPSFFLKDWSKSKAWLLNLFGDVVNKAKKTKDPHQAQTLLQSVLELVEPKCAANFSFLMMWATLANAIPMTVWTLGFIMSDKVILTKLKKEIERELGSDNEVEMSYEKLKKLEFVKRCVLEAIRLRSPGVITREVTAPISVEGYIIPEGDMLMMSPYWAHRDPKYFPDPEQFKPDRWLSAELQKNAFLEGFVAFGGGRYQCPGKWFALMEIQLFVCLVLHKFDMKLTEPLPRHSTLHLVGTQQPEGPIPVRYTRR